MPEFANRDYDCIAVAALVSMVLGLAGCRDDTSLKGKLPTFKARGTVTMDGQPFGPAHLIFTAEDSNQPAPTGVVDAAGNVELFTYVKGDGAPAGTYKVTVSDDPTIPAPPHPQIYEDSVNTPLAVFIKDSGPNDFKLELDPKIGPMASGGIPGIPNAPGGATMDAYKVAPSGSSPTSKP